jgi:hypothetical protein
MNVPAIHINTPVWGEAYTRCFIDIGLGSLLAPNNLPALDRARGNILQVMTTEADREIIEASAAWRHARDVIDCEIEIIGRDAVSIDQPHVTMSDCHRRAISFADSRGAAIMLYNPDIVIADGGMQALVRLLAAGKRAIQVVGLRLLKDEVVPLLMRQHADADGTSIVVSPRALMAIAMDHLHPLTMMHLYDAPDLDLMPQEVFWRVGKEGLVARCFHIHPILVYPRVRNAAFSTTVDDDYLRSACPDASEEYVITDSDEFCLCELSGLARSLTGLPRTGDDLDIVKWAWAHARPHHVEHFCRRIFLHAGRVSEAEWRSACTQSDEAVERILNHLVDLRAAEAARQRS